MTRIDHSTHDHAATKVARAICRKALAAETVIEVAPIEAAANPTKVKVVNMTDGSVEVHAPGCADPRKKDPMAESYTATYDSIHAIWADYNEDFMDEGEGATYAMNVYKCTGMTDRKVSYHP